MHLTETLHSSTIDSVRIYAIISYIRLHGKGAELISGFETSVLLILRLF